jgi:hypothetical protein
MKTFQRVAGLLASFAMGSSCGSLLDARYDYNLSIINTGTQNIWCSLVSSGRGMAHEPGVLVPNKRKTFAGPFKVPISDNWSITWRNGAGNEVTQTINLNGTAPDRFIGELRFIIDSDNNKIDFRTVPRGK